jgi:hypothetical protein
LVDDSLKCGQTNSKGCSIKIINKDVVGDNKNVQSQSYHKIGPLDGKVNVAEVLKDTKS